MTKPENRRKPVRLVPALRRRPYLVETLRITAAVQPGSGRPQHRAVQRQSTGLTAMRIWVEEVEAHYLYPSMDQVYTSCSHFLRQLSLHVSHTQRHELFSQVQPLTVAATLSVEEEQANRALVYAGSILLLNSIGKLFYPPLMLLSVPLILRIGIPFLEKAVQDWHTHRKIGTAALDVAITLGMIAAKAFWTNALFHVLFAVSHQVQLKTRQQMRQHLVNLLGEMPRFVWVEGADAEVALPIEQVEAGDLIIAHAGEILPVDGMIIAGFALIDQHTLTGEAQPVEKAPGDPVYAGTLLLSGTLRVQVENAGVATIAGQVGTILQHTAEYHAGLELRGQQLADQSVVPSLAIGAVTLTTLGVAAATAAITCSVGYQMRFTGPLSVLNFLNLAAEAGILIKDGRALEQLAQIDTVVFDKTGTLTQEEPTLTQIHPLAGFTAHEVLRLAAAAEVKQQHPLARAILRAAQQRGVALPTSAEVTYVVGYGLRVMLEQQLVQVGSARFMQQAGVVLPAQIHALQMACQEKGHTLVYVAQAGALVGLLELRTTLRPEALQVIQTLRQRGLQLVILSGDHEQPTRQLAHALGIEHYIAETLPADKGKVIEELQQAGKRVCFVGDGINDALALKKANASVSLRGATTIALDTAQIILRDQTLTALTDLFSLADRFQATMRVNFWASTVPGIFSLAGVYLLNFGVFAAGCLAWSGLALGLTNTMWPIWQQHWHRRFNQRQDDRPALPPIATGYDLPPHSPDKNGAALRQ